MFSLTIVFGASTPVLWTLLFQTEERARHARTMCALAFQPDDNGDKGKGVIGLSDDFSQEVMIEAAHISGFMLEDLDKSQLGQVEKAMHDRRAQVKFEALVNSDPGMRAQHRQPSMPILQPMGNGFRPVS